MRAEPQWPDQRGQGGRRIGGGWILFTAGVLGLLAGAGAAALTML